MPLDIEDLLTRCRQLQQSGKQRPEVVQYLYDNNLLMAEAVKTVCSLYSIDLFEADTIVRSHPAWRELGAISEHLAAQFGKVVANYSKVRLLTDRSVA